MEEASEAKHKQVGVNLSVLFVSTVDMIQFLATSTFPQ